MTEERGKKKEGRLVAVTSRVSITVFCKVMFLKLSLNSVKCIKSRPVKHEKHGGTRFKFISMLFAVQKLLVQPLSFEVNWSRDPTSHIHLSNTPLY